AMTEAVETVATGAVTVASRDVDSNGVEIRKGAWLGLADGEPVAGGDSFDEVAHAVLARLLAEPRGVLTLLTGEEPPQLDGLRADIDVIASVATGNEAPMICAELLPDVVLMDYRMPGLNGAQATEAVLRASPSSSVVCLTASVSRKEVDQLLAAGAVACLTKD